MPPGLVLYQSELEHKAYWALKHVNFDIKTAGDHRKLQLNELNELRDQAYENSLIYKEKTKKLHDSNIKNRIFNVGPFTIAQVFPYGTVELSQPDGPNFKVNGHRVKHYFGGDIPPKFGEVLRYDITNNTRKRSKTEQTRTREGKSAQERKIAINGHMADFHHLDDARDILISVKARSWSYDSRGTSAPTHSAFISAASTNSKMSYPEQSHSTTFTSASSSPAASSNVIENVLHSFVAESDPQQQITYEDFDQIGKLDLEE
ncbi:hypothetical protein Tco_0990186 [Tanacetum coccineum]|uniref:Reverse transcriptase domain-containing protein n=1 Tax=Tanacetum coccineum TaxID=301880 RepID=A0ABQ5EX58_9ASTR